MLKKTEKKKNVIVCWFTFRLETLTNIASK